MLIPCCPIRQKCWSGLTNSERLNWNPYDMHRSVTIHSLEHICLLTGMFLPFVSWYLSKLTKWSIWKKIGRLQIQNNLSLWQVYSFWNGFAFVCQGKVSYSLHYDRLIEIAWLHTWACILIPKLVEEIILYRQEEKVGKRFLLKKMTISNGTHYKPKYNFPSFPLQFLQAEP